MFKALSAAFLLFLSACGPVIPSYGQFDPYVSAFTSYAASHRIDTDFSNLRVIYLVDDLTSAGTNVAAACSLRSGSYDSIQVLSSWWKIASETRRTMVIIHELGHCVLRLRYHDDSKQDFGGGDVEPKSIMASTLFSEAVFLAHREYYMQELFSKRP